MIFRNKTNFFIVVLILFFTSCGGRANPEKMKCMNTFYQTKDYACVKNIISQLDTTRNEKELDSLTNYMGAVFKHYPEFKEKALSEKVSLRTKAVFLGDLHIAGLAEEAKKYATENKLETILEAYKTKRVKTLDQIKTPYTPTENDILISGFLVSGETDYIKRLLNSYKNLTFDELSYAVRMGLLTTKFGSTMAPKGRKSDIIQTLCTKYNCKSDPKKFMQIMSVSSAHWALNSLAEKHEKIKNTMVDFYEQNKKISEIVYKENVMLSNYMVLIIASTAIQNNEAINQLMSDYENLKDMDFKKMKEIEKNVKPNN